MSRTLAVLIALVAAAGVSQMDHTPAVAQDKKKDKKKDKAPAPAAGEAADDLAKVLPVFDPGSHTRPILAMGFTKDAAKLVTVARDYTVQVWAAATGERLNVFRLPGYGHEKGFNPGRWSVAAVSADGTRVAMGGEAKALAIEDGLAADTRLVLLDIPSRTMRRVQIPGNGYTVEALSFSPDGDTLAVAIDRGQAKQSDLVVVSGLTGRLAAAGTGSIVPKDCPKVETPHPKGVGVAAFSPDGRKLLLGGKDHVVSVWDVATGVPAPRPVLAKEIATDEATVALAWSPDGTRFLRSGSARGANATGLDYLDVTGARVRHWLVADLAPAADTYGRFHSMSFLGPDTVYLVCRGFVGKDSLPGTRTALLDLPTGKSTLLTTHTSDTESHPCGAVAPGKNLVAATVAGTDVAVLRPEPGAAVVRCGAHAPVPFHVGWAKNPAAPGFAWGEERRSAKKEGTAAGLSWGFDLVKVEPVGAVKGADYVPTRRKLDDWTLDSVRGVVTLKQTGQEEGVRMPGAALLRGRTLIPNPGGPPLVAFGQHVAGGADGDQGWLFQGDGTRVTRLVPDATSFHDLASSPDGRFVVASTGTPRLVVYRTDGTASPFISFAQLNGEWVAWTAEGYYAASPGGERLFGFAVNNGPNALVSFHPAERFAKHFRRPDVLKRAIELGSVRAALADLGVAAQNPANVLPPTVRIDLLSRNGARVRVRATAVSPNPDKPVLAMRVMNNTRGIGAWTPGPGPAVAEFEFELESQPRLQDLTVFARNADGSSVSEPITVRGPRPTGPLPTLYRVCIGVSEYDNSGLRLSNAAKDARDMFDALAGHCVGPDNVFGDAKGTLLVDKDATRERALAAIADAARKSRPGDLVIVFFAGHGKKHGDEYYLYTRETNAPDGVKGTALAGEELREALREAEGTVLLAIDACHSAGAAAAFRPALTDLTRDLGSSTSRVTVLSAAAAEETAGSGKTAGPNGAFTAAMLKALRAGTPFDRVEGAMSVQHLYMAVFDDVRVATNGNQNPTLYRPEGTPTLFVRSAPTGVSP